LGKTTYIENTKCPGCNELITSNYCSNCGEKKFKRIQMSDVIGDFMSNLINIEGPILNTIKDLIIRPGKMIRDYLNGNRNKYYKPFQFYILATTAYFLFFYLWGNEMLEMFKDLGSGYNTTATEAQIDAFQLKMNEFQENNMRSLSFLQLPIYGWLIWLFFKKKSGDTFTETLVASLYIMGQILILGILFTFLVHLHSSLPMIISMAFMLVYFPWVLKQLYKESPPKTILKSLAIIALGFILYGILIAIISVIWILIFTS